MKTCFIFFILVVLYLASAFSTAHAQTHWTKDPGNPVLSPDQRGAWDDYGVYAPFVLQHGDTLKMWYTGIKSFGVQQIGYATSTDGISWKKYPHNPVLKVGTPGSWDAEYVGYPKIILIDTTYHMWYGGVKDFNNQVFRLGYATSSDGINWTKHPDPVLPLGDPGEWDSASGGGYSCFFDGDTFHLWYAGCENLTTRRYRTGYAKSPDGINWEKYPGNPIFYGAGSWDSLKIHNPCVIVDNAGYKMWYQGRYESNYRIGYATSRDGIQWTALDTFVLDIGAPGAWDDKMVGTPHVFLDDDIYRIWFTGSDNGTPDYLYHIGYATAVVSTLEEVDYGGFPKEFALKQNYPNPFNPVTAIGYQLSAVSEVTITIYNVVGQEVATLVSERQHAGHHQVEWNAGDYASGIYYYQLLAGNYREFKKMVLLK